MDILETFLHMFAPRKICGACLARLTDEPLLATDRRLEGMVHDGTVSVTAARCVNCDEDRPGFSLS